MAWTALLRMLSRLRTHRHPRRPHRQPVANLDRLFLVLRKPTTVPTTDCAVAPRGWAHSCRSDLTERNASAAIPATEASRNRTQERPKPLRLTAARSPSFLCQNANRQPSFAELQIQWRELPPVSYLQPLGPRLLTQPGAFRFVGHSRAAPDSLWLSGGLPADLSTCRAGRFFSSGRPVALGAYRGNIIAIRCGSA